MKQQNKPDQLKKLIKKELVLTASEMKKDLGWFCFAKKNKCGWRFLKNKEKQWEMLEEIAHKLAKKYPSYRTGEIVDAISKVVNGRC